MNEAMERLRNKTILIGKEPENGRLLISIKINGQIKNAVMGNINSACLIV